MGCSPAPWPGTHRERVRSISRPRARSCRRGARAIRASSKWLRLGVSRRHAGAAEAGTNRPADGATRSRAAYAVAPGVMVSGGVLRRRRPQGSKSAAGGFGAASSSSKKALPRQPPRPENGRALGASATACPSRGRRSVRRARPGSRAPSRRTRVRRARQDRAWACSPALPQNPEWS